MTKKLMLDYYARLSEEQKRTNLFATTDIDEAIFLADQLLVMSHIPTRVRASSRSSCRGLAISARC